MATTITYTLVPDACIDRSPGSCRSHQIDLSERFIAEIALIAMALIQSRLDLGRIDSRVCVLFCLVQPFPPTLLCAIYFIERQSVIVFHSYIHTHTRVGCFVLQFTPYPHWNRRCSVARKRAFARSYLKVITYAS